MAEMGRYCKAYLVRDLAAFEGWQPDVTNLQPAEKAESGDSPETREALADDDVLYVHEDFRVTDGIYQDEHIIFTGEDDAWKSFCTEQLAFAVPDDVAQLPTP